MQMVRADDSSSHTSTQSSGQLAWSEGWQLLGAVPEERRELLHEDNTTNTLLIIIIIIIIIPMICKPL